MTSIGFLTMCIGVFLAIICLHICLSRFRCDMWSSQPLQHLLFLLLKVLNFCNEGKSKHITRFNGFFSPNFEQSRVSNKEHEKVNYCNLNCSVAVLKLTTLSVEKTYSRRKFQSENCKMISSPNERHLV